MATNESFWRAHGIETALLVLVIFLTGLLLHMNSRLSKVSTALDVKITRAERTMGDLKAHVEEQFNVLDGELERRLSMPDKTRLSPGHRVSGKHGQGVTGKKFYPAPEQSLDLRTVADPEIESLALNWGLLRRAFPRRLQDSKRAYLDLINQLGFPVTEQQRMQMRKVVHETFGLVECITLSAGWEE